MNPVSLVPFVCGAGASTPGAEQGAVYCREHGLTEKLLARGIKAEWATDPDIHWTGPYGQTAHAALPPRGSPERHEIVAWHCHALAENVAAELRLGNRVVTIGGDHSMAAGSVSGVQMAMDSDAVLGMIWVDAHPDLHTFESSSTKSLHGMAMATLLGLDGTLAVPEMISPVLRPENVIYMGLRDIDRGEWDNAAKLGMNLITMEDLRSQGVAAVLQDAVTRLGAACDHIVLSVDLDGFSSAVAPATGTPVEGGFIPEEILPVLAGIVRAFSVPLIELVEFNPTLPGAAKTYDFMVDVLGALLPGD
ncbi:MAG: arginase [Micavibrio sp.]